MPAVVVFIIFVICLVIAIPVSISLGIASVLPGAFDPSFTASGTFVVRSMLGGLDSFPLLAVPMFVLSGIIMARGGISRKLFDIFAYFMGARTAGMPCAVIVTCLFYGAISGSGPATVAAVGSMTIPILIEMGYDKTFSTAVVAVAGGLGVIIPPSIPFIMYGSASGASVSDLFIAGIIPGLLIGFLLMVYAYIYCKKHGEDQERKMKMVKRLPVRFKRQLSCPVKPGYHPWLHLQRDCLSYRGCCDLRILCADHQSVCISQHQNKRYLEYFSGIHPYLHTDPVHPGRIHRFFQSPDSDAGAPGSQRLDPDPLYQSGRPSAGDQCLPSDRRHGHGHHTSHSDPDSDPAADRNRHRHESDSFWCYDGRQSCNRFCHTAYWRKLICCFFSV